MPVKSYTTDRCLSYTFILPVKHKVPVDAVQCSCNHLLQLCLQHAPRLVCVASMQVPRQDPCLTPVHLPQCSTVLLIFHILDQRGRTSRSLVSQTMAEMSVHRISDHGRKVRLSYFRPGRTHRSLVFQTRAEKSVPCISDQDGEVGPLYLRPVRRSRSLVSQTRCRLAIS